MRSVLHAQMGDLATGGGAVWLPLAASILRIDERTGSVYRFRTGRLDTGGFQHVIAVGAGALWMVQQDTRHRSLLVQRSLVTGHVLHAVALPGIADAVQVTGGAVWVGVAPSTLLRFDARTLRRTLTVNAL
jgi:hypothetical protein